MCMTGTVLLNCCSLPLQGPGHVLKLPTYISTGRNEMSETKLACGKCNKPEFMDGLCLFHHYTTIITPVNPEKKRSSKCKECDSPASKDGLCASHNKELFTDYCSCHGLPMDGSGMCSISARY